MGEEDDDDAGPCEKICGGLCTMVLGCVIFPIVIILIAVNERRVVCRRAAATKISGWDEANCDKKADGEFIISCTVSQPDDNTIPAAAQIVGISNVAVNAATAWNRVQRTPDYYVCTPTDSTTNPKFKWEYSSSPQKAINCAANNFTDVRDGGCGGFVVANCNQPGPRKVSVTAYNAFLVGKYTYPIDVSPFRPSGNDYTPAAANVIQGAYSYATNSNSCTNKFGCYRMKNSLDVVKHSQYTFPAVITSGNIKAAEESGPFYCSESTVTGILTKKATPEEWLKTELGAQNTTSWIFRVLLLFAAWGAVYMCCAPIASGADVVGDYLAMIPAVGEQLETVLEGAVDCLVISLSCVMGCSCGLLCMALFWVLVRPLLAIPVLLVGCLAVGGGIYYGQNTENENAEKIKAKKAKRKAANPYGAEMDGGQELVEES